MRPDATSQFIAATHSSYIQPALFVQVGMVTGPVFVWSGAGPITWNGNVWQGVGQLGGISTIEDGSDVQARGIVLTLSGIDPTLLSDVLNDYAQGLPAIVYLGLFDSSNGNLIPNPITCWSGRTDQPTITVSGDSATISISCENRLVEMNISVARRYSNADQQLDYPNDLGFSFVDSIQGVTIYWGRHPSAQNNNFSQGTSG